MKTDNDMSRDREDENGRQRTWEYLIGMVVDPNIASRFNN